MIDMSKRSKRYLAALESYDKGEPMELSKAVEVLKSMPNANFDETIELHINLGVDPRKSDQMIRGSYSLPHGTGKTNRVIAFCEGDDATAATGAGAIEAGGEDLVEKVSGGWMDFDVAIATAPMMRHVRKLGRVLGPQGKMPSPKAGTVTDDVEKAVREFVAGKIEYRIDSGSVLHLPVGKKSFDKDKLQENIQNFLTFLASQRPATAKGSFIKKVTLCPTMGPGVPVVVVRN